MEKTRCNFSCRGEHRDREIETRHVIVEKTLKDERLAGRGTLETEGSRISAASSAELGNLSCEHLDSCQF